MQQPRRRLSLEITGILLIKLALIFAIKLIWFSDRPAIDAQSQSEHLLAPASRAMTPGHQLNERNSDD